MALSSWKFTGPFAGIAATLLAKIFDTSSGHSHDGVDSRKIAVTSFALANGKILVGDAGGAAAAVTPSGDVTIDNAGVAAIGAKKVTYAKAALFISTEQTGTGAAQNIAHGLGAVPAKVLVTPTDLTPATVGSYVVTEGTHDGTNVVVTVTSGKKFKVLAIA